MSLKDILEYDLFAIGGYQITIIDLLEVMVILLLTRIFIWVFSGILKRLLRRRKMDSGEQFAVIQLMKYIIYPIAILLALEAIGIKPTILLAGSAALLVGLGLGIQSIFNDLVSGVILLIEGTVSVDDIVIVDGIVGKVQSISIRTSKVETRDDITIIVPNSKFISSEVINWSYNGLASRFDITIGVAYNSDIALVDKVMIETAAGHDRVLATPAPVSYLNNMGDNALEFNLHFYSQHFWEIELIKSELRKQILIKFREYGIQIPFPQRDLWIRSVPPADQAAERP